jgi:hypothetical protein
MNQHCVISRALKLACGGLLHILNDDTCLIKAAQLGVEEEEDWPADGRSHCAAHAVCHQQKPHGAPVDSMAPQLSLRVVLQLLQTCP